MTMDPEQVSETRAIKLMNWVVDHAVKGIRPLSSCENLAQEYLIDPSYPHNEARIDSLINWETTKNFTSGFITGLGGLLTLPIAIPSALGASWIIQARMVGAIASIHGHDAHDDRVRSLILLSLVGDSVKEVLKQAGIEVDDSVTSNYFNTIPGRLLIELNTSIGLRLLSRAGKHGLLKFTKVIPIAGGVISGGFDAYTCRKVGYIAHDLFKPE